MQKSKHSKFKNTGILFELLTRQVTADILSGRQESLAKDLLFKYFKESTELGKEWQLYNFLINEQFLDEVKADRAIETVLRVREKLNQDKLNTEKYNLIKEIKDSYPIEQFLKSSIKEYKVYASIYKVFKDRIEESGSNIEEVVQARSYLIENLISIKKSPEAKEDTLLDHYKKETEDVRLLAYKFLVENLNKKYSSLDSSQKKILSEYINNISNTNSIALFVDSEKDKLKKELTEIVDKVDSQITKIKLTEVIHQIDRMKFNKGIKDNHVMILLLSYELLKEIKKNVEIV